MYELFTLYCYWYIFQYSIFGVRHNNSNCQQKSAVTILNLDENLSKARKLAYQDLK